MEDTLQRYRKRKLNRLKTRLDSGDNVERMRTRRAIRILEREIFNGDGGAGSGNWGHVGRPGIKGGSAGGGGLAFRGEKNREGKYASTVKERRGETESLNRRTSAVIKDIHRLAEANEPDISKTVKAAIEGIGARMDGFDHRLKSEDSLTRKYQKDLKEKLSHDIWKEHPDKARETVRTWMTDVVRYTCLSTEENYANDFNNLVKELEKQGHKIIKVNNTMADEDTDYRGVNCIVEDKKGYRYELQVHTEQSLKIKEINHKLYEKARTLEDGDPQREALEAEMRKNAATIPMPNGASTIKSFDKTGLW